METFKIPQDVIDEVVAALNRAIGFAMAKNDPEMVDGFSKAAIRLDEAINAADED